VGKKPTERKKEKKLDRFIVGKKPTERKKEKKLDRKKKDSINKRKEKSLYE